MSGALDRHRARKMEVADVDVFGDSSQTELATGAIAELLKTAGSVAAAEQKKKEDAAKAEKEKKEKEAATAAAKTARSKANKDAGDARLAEMKAQNEKESWGPLHQLSLAAADRATASEAEAVELEIKAGVTPSFSALSAHSVATAHKGGGFPTWGWWVLGGVGVLGAGLVTYKLLKKK